MDLASVVAALASVGVRVSGSTPNNNIQGDSSRACPTGLAGPEPSGTLNDPGQHFHTHLARAAACLLAWLLLLAAAAAKPGRSTLDTKKGYETKTGSTRSVTLTLIKTECWDRAGGGGNIRYEW